MRDLRLSLPGLGRVVIVRDPARIVRFDRRPEVDRQFAAPHSRLARLFRNRITCTLAFDGRFFPALEPRASRAREAATAAMQARLAAHPASDKAVAELAAFIRGEAQASGIDQIVRRGIAEALGVDPEQVTAERAGAARLLARALRFDPLRWFIARRTGRLARAQRELAALCGGDVHTGHAIVAAAPNIVTAAERLRRMHSEEPRPDAQATVRASLSPPLVLRTIESAVPTGEERPIRAGTLLVYRPRGEAAGEDWGDRIFAERRWTACPAQGWVVTWLETAWTRAGGAG